MSEEETWTGKVFVVETVRGAVDAPLGWLSFLVFWFSMATVVGDRLLPDGAMVVTPWLLFGSVLLAMFVSILHRLRKRSNVAVRADDGGLHLQRKKWKTTILRKDILSGHVRPRLGAAEVELWLRDRTILRIALESRSEARALLAALGRDAAHRPATIAVPGTEGRYALGCFSAFVHLLLFGVAFTVFKEWGRPPEPIEALLFLLANVFVSYLFVRIARPREVTIGLDAVVVKEAFWRRTIPWSRIDRFDSSEAGVFLDLKPAPGARRFWGGKAVGKTLQLRTGSSYGSTAALFWRLEEARVLRDRIEDDRIANRVTRDGRKLDVWRSAVASLLGSGGEGYRRAAVSVEALRAIAASPSATVEQRLGAALALGAVRDREATEAVRAAARSVVSPKLRIALREAVRPNPDERAIEEALAEEEARGEHGSGKSTHHDSGE